MPLKGSVKFIFECKSDGIVEKSNLYPDMIDDQTITMEVPYVDMNINQYFNLFNSFLRSVGFDEILIMKGACGLAFSDMRNQEDMCKVAEEFDLMLSEDHMNIVRDLQKEIIELMQKLSHFENINDLQDSMKPWNGLTPGSDEAYHSGCICPVLDNQEMPDDKKWVNTDCPIHGKVK